MEKKTAEPTQSPAIPTPYKYIPYQPALFDLDEIPLLAKQPNPDTLEAVCLQRLGKGAEFSQLEWSRWGFGWRLAAVIKSLRYMGWQIESYRVKHNRSKIARYRATPETMHAFYKIGKG